MTVLETKEAADVQSTSEETADSSVPAKVSLRSGASNQGSSYQILILKLIEFCKKFNQC